MTDDTTTPIDTTTSGAPVDEVERLRGALDLSMRTLTETLHGILDVIAPDGDGYVMENGDIAWDAVWETLTAGYVHEADRRPNVPAVPARVSTPAELDALPSYTVVICQTGEAWQRGNPMAEGWHLAGGDIADYGDEDLIQSLPAAIVYRPDRDLLAEAEARGVARGRREALIDLRSRVYNGAPDPYQAFYNYGLAPLLDAEIERAAETPGGAA